MLRGAFQDPDHVHTLVWIHTPGIMIPGWSSSMDVHRRCPSILLLLCVCHVELPHGTHRRLCSLRVLPVLCSVCIHTLWGIPYYQHLLSSDPGIILGMWCLVSRPTSSPDHWISWIHVLGCCGVIVFIYAACTALSTHCSVYVLAVVLHMHITAPAVLVVTTCLIILIWILWGSFRDVILVTASGILDLMRSWVLDSSRGGISYPGIISLGYGLHPRAVPLCVSIEQRCCRLSEYPLLLPFAGTRGNPRSIIRVP